MRLDELVTAARGHGPQGMSRDDLLALTEQLELPDDLVETHLAFDPDSYARNLVLRTPDLELLVLCWLPGQRSTIHDHGGSVGVVRVHKGDLTSRLYSAPDGEPARMVSEDVVGPGTHAAVDLPDIHQLANESRENLVTIHLYSPPLSALGVYRTDSAGARAAEAALHAARRPRIAGGIGRPSGGFGGRPSGVAESRRPTLWGPGDQRLRASPDTTRQNSRLRCSPPIPGAEGGPLGPSRGGRDGPVRGAAAVRRGGAAPAASHSFPAVRTAARNGPRLSHRPHRRPRLMPADPRRWDEPPGAITAPDPGCAGAAQADDQRRAAGAGQGRPP